MGARPLPLCTPPSSLANRLRERIRRDGPLSVEHYMQACLTDPAAGYYASHQPIGASGDFITSPEISQMFGELLGAWVVAIWQSMGEPRSITIAELGPGRGTLLADTLRLWRGVAQFLASASIALIETSPVLREAQAATLRDAKLPIAWHAKLDEVADGPLILIANEFLDALPVRQVLRRGNQWRERMIGLAGDGGFAFVEGDAVSVETLPPSELLGRAPDGAILETRPEATRLVGELAQRAARAPLAALFIDYGHDESGFGDTLQAVRAHRYADPLAAPGEADLSAHVDFAELARSAEAAGLNAYGPMPQGEFLLKLGLGQRRDRLLATASPVQRAALASGAARLADPQAMGVLFKVLALTSPSLPPPAPFGRAI